MGYVADLHIHSRFSRACSPQLTIPNLAEAAKLKGIKLLGTGDFLHPLWYSELKRDLKEEGNGLFSSSGIYFILSTEVSLIYSHNGRGRRIHLLVMLPSFESAEKLQHQLYQKQAKLSSDGRPILGISTQAFCELVFSIEPKAILIPAHIWTPWFGMFGSQSGYDSFDECFGSFADNIYAIETGMSSDPAMNWRVGQLDSKSIVSFSDPHSLPKMGREATIFSGEISYSGLLNDLQKQGVEGTIEFYPQEGKYHFDGHRNCQFSQSPQQTRKSGTVCPKCGRDLTLGVMYQVDKLATRDNQELEIKNLEGWVVSESLKRPKYRMLVPLLEIIAEAFSVGVASQKVDFEYKKLTTSLRDEISILTQVNIGEIAKISGGKVAEGVEKVRKGDLVIEPGFDGVYGVVKIWDEEGSSSQESVPQLGLFD